MASMDISWTTIIIVILLIVVGYFIWSIVTSSSSTTSTGTTKLNTPTTLALTQNSKSNSFTFSIWIAINKWSDSGANIVSTSTATVAANKFALKLGTLKNDLNINIGTEASFRVVGFVPLQTWASIIVSINNGNSADIYINGKLVNTFPIATTYTLTATDVTVGGPTTIDGYISATFENKSIGPQEAWKIYSSGYGGGGGGGVGAFFNKYKIRFAFVKDNVELSRLDI
jgi:hypothetical protein